MALIPAITWQWRQCEASKVKVFPQVRGGRYPWSDLPAEKERERDPSIDGRANPRLTTGLIYMRLL
jgi:hypothetical protein